MNHILLINSMANAHMKEHQCLETAEICADLNEKTFKGPVLLLKTGCCRILFPGKLPTSVRVDRKLESADFKA